MDVYVLVAAMAFILGGAIFAGVAWYRSEKAVAKVLQFAEVVDEDAAAVKRDVERATHERCKAQDFTASAGELRNQTRVWAQIAERASQHTANDTERAAECAELIKVEVAKVGTLIERLSKERAENPPLISIVHGEEEGAAKVVTMPNTMKQDEILRIVELLESDGCASATVVLPDGVPFAFDPIQVQPPVFQSEEDMA